MAPVGKAISVDCLGWDEFLALESAWPALQERTGHRAPFYRHDFLRIWIDNFGRGRPTRCLVARDDTGLRAALCLLEERKFFRGAPVRMLHGAANMYSERYDLIAARDDDAAIDAIWRHLRDELSWQVIELPDVPPEGAARGLLTRAAHEVPVGFWESKRAPWMALEGTFDAFLAARSPKFRRNLRRRRERLLAQDRMILERVGGGFDLEHSLEQGFILEASGWKSRSGTAIAKLPPVRAFFAELARQASAHGYLSLYFLRAGDRPVAFFFGLEDNRHYYLFKLGIDDAARALAPGHLLVAEVVRDSLERGIIELDFLGTDAPWKTDWTETQRPHDWCYIFPDTLLGRCLYAAKFKTKRLASFVKRKARAS